MPGVPYGDIVKICEDVAFLKNSVDFVIVSLHWGTEHYLYPSTEQISMGHAIVDAGASVVIGHHPHVVQGYERYKNGLIFYSLGNFVFDDLYWEGRTCSGIPFVVDLPLSPLNEESVAIELLFAHNGSIDFRYRRFKISMDTFEIVETSDEECLSSFQKLSRKFGRSGYSLLYRFYALGKESKIIIAHIASDLVRFLKNPFKLRVHHIVYQFNRMVSALKSISGRRIG